MLKAGKKEEEIQQILWKRYVEVVVNKQPKEPVEVRFAYPAQTGLSKIKHHLLDE
jgi:hypothetical protein